MMKQRRTERIERFVSKEDVELILKDYDRYEKAGEIHSLNEVTADITLALKGCGVKCRKAKSYGDFKRIIRRNKRKLPVADKMNDRILLLLFHIWLGEQVEFFDPDETIKFPACSHAPIREKEFLWFKTRSDAQEYLLRLLKNTTSETVRAVSAFAFDLCTIGRYENEPSTHITALISCAEKITAEDGERYYTFPKIVQKMEKELVSLSEHFEYRYIDMYITFSVYLTCQRKVREKRANEDARESEFRGEHENDEQKRISDEIGFACNIKDLEEMRKELEYIASKGAKTIFELQIKKLQKLLSQSGLSFELENLAADYASIIKNIVSENMLPTFDEFINQYQKLANLQPQNSRLRRRILQKVVRKSYRYQKQIHYQHEYMTLWDAAFLLNWMSAKKLDEHGLPKFSLSYDLRYAVKLYKRISKLPQGQLDLAAYWI